MKKQLPDPKFEGHRKDGTPVGSEALAILEEQDIAFDATKVTLDLTKAEKRRTTALMLAIQAYSEIIIKDAEYLRVSLDHQRGGGPVIQPATMDSMVEAAIQFDAFISGAFSVPVDTTDASSEQPTPSLGQENLDAGSHAG